MLRNRPALISDTIHAPTFTFHHSGKSVIEKSLLEFLDNFDIYLFVYDDEYRMRLNNILDLFSDEEFESFERTHARRFTVN